MTTLSIDLYSNLGDSCEESSLAHSDVSLVKVWNVVIPVNLINALEASLFDHLGRTPRSFLGRLVKKSDELVAWDLVSRVEHSLRAGSDCSHVSIMATKMGKISCRLVV